MNACCPRCRLLQPEAARCAHCGDVRPLRDDELDQLVGSRIEGVEDDGLPSRSSLRFHLGGIVGTMVGGWIGDLLAQSTLSLFAGMMAGGLVGAFGGTRIPRMSLVRRRQLRPIREPEKPTANVVELDGTAKVFERSIVSMVTDGQPLVAASVSVRVDGGLVLRAVRSAPFWLIANAGRRVLVTGECWTTSPSPVAMNVSEPILRRLEVPANLLIPKRTTIAEARAAHEDRITVIGTLREERFAGLGYRDTPIETMRGAPGEVVWIERMA